MGRRVVSTLVMAAIGTGSAAGVATAQPDLPDSFSVVPVVAGLSEPVGMALLPDGRVLFVEQRTARIRLVVDGALAAVDPVATLPAVDASGFEQGLLGIAVDPGWPGRPFVYVHACDSDLGTVRVSRYTAAGDLAGAGNGSLTVDPATRLDLIRDVPDLADNHNGGSVRFGPDGMLYASFGEDADECGAQDPTRLKGVILRMDVTRLPAARTEPAPRALVIPAGNPFATHPDSNARLVWAYGLRNPFRFSVDPSTGVLWIGDVGQNRWEEVDRAASGGINFGWPWREGPESFEPCGIGGPGAPPEYAYDRSGFTASVIMAGPSRSAFGPAYEGDVFFSDYYVGFVRRLASQPGGTWAIAPVVPGQPNATDWAIGLPHVSDWQFGPDSALWFVRQSNDAFQANSGSIGRIVAAVDTSTPPPPPPAPASRPSFAPLVPTPARDAATLRFTLPRAAVVTLALHDVSGRRVRTLLDGVARDAGTHDVPWDGRDDDGAAVRPGLYVARLTAGGVTIERRVPFLR